MLTSCGKRSVGSSPSDSGSRASIVTSAIRTRTSGRCTAARVKLWRQAEGLDIQRRAEIIDNRTPVRLGVGGERHQPGDVLGLGPGQLWLAVGQRDRGAPLDQRDRGLDRRVAAADDQRVLADEVLRVVEPITDLW